MNGELPAMAKQLATRRVRVETRRSQRMEGDCLRVAVAEAYGRVHDFWYEDTPEVTGYDSDQQERWEAWAIERGLRWWTSFEFAPVHLAAWVASVDSREGADMLHAIPFTYERPILPPDSAFIGTGIEDVRDARWLFPAGVAMPAGRLRRIANPLPGKPSGILYQAPYNNRPGSTWIEATVGGLNAPATR